VKRELGLFLVREMTMLRQSRNKGVGLKNQYHLFNHGEIFQIYMKKIYGDSPVVSEITNFVVVLKGLKMFVETLQINCSVI
jgi:hypothetical protein